MTSLIWGRKRLAKAQKDNLLSKRRYRSSAPTCSFFPSILWQAWPCNLANSHPEILICDYCLWKIIMRNHYRCGRYTHHALSHTRGWHWLSIKVTIPSTSYACARCRTRIVRYLITREGPAHTACPHQAWSGLRTWTMHLSTMASHSMQKRSK